MIPGKYTQMQVEMKMWVNQILSIQNNNNNTLQDSNLCRIKMHDNSNRKGREGKCSSNAPSPITDHRGKTIALYQWYINGYQ